MDQDVTLHFDGWQLRPAQRLLLVNDSPVDVGSRALDVLLALVERRGRVVAKAELLDVAWRGLVVEENNVSVHVSALRKLLGPRVIATVVGIGYRFIAAPRPVDTPPTLASEPEPADAPPVLTPPLPGLFGREGDVDALSNLVGHQPLVSIVGTGGVGKTSLARAVLARRRQQVTEDVYWLDLAPLQEGAQLTAALAKSLGVLGTQKNPHEELLTALSRSHSLIVLDNCEHLLPAVAGLVRQVLDAAPHVRWVTTSQAPLQLTEEVVYRLQPLEVPRADATLTDASRSGALALLCHRAAAADRHFELTPSNLSAAVDLCWRLDGLPLAIEMAAGLVATLGLEAVHEQLDQRLRLLTGPRGAPTRHLTLRSTFDWSYRLLSPAERRVFRFLQPFLGGFNTTMAQQIAHDGDAGSADSEEWEVLTALRSLIDRSLVHGGADTPRRFFLFESAREYARLMLAEAGETEFLQRRHAEVVAGYFASARADQDRLRDAQWSRRYLAERHNVRAALTWASERGEPDLLAGLVAALAQIDSFSRSQAEIVHWHLPMDVLERATPALRAAACVELSWAHFLDGNRKTGTELALRGLADFRALGDAAGTYQALAQLVRLYESRPDMLDKARDAAHQLRQIDDRDVPLRGRLFRAITAGLQYEGDRTVARLRELHDLALRAGFDTLAAVCRVHITDALLIERRFDEVVQEARQFIAAGESRPRVNATIRINLILALVQLGRASEAVDAAHTVLRTLPSAAYLVIAAFALAAVREQRWAHAALMSGYCAHVRSERDQRADPAEAAATEETTASLAAALSPDRLRQLRQDGSALSLAEAWALLTP